MSRKTRFTPETIKAMVHEYETGSSGKDLAVAFECSLPTVYKFLAVGHAKIREGRISDFSDEVKAKMAAAYKAGATVRELVEKFDCSSPTVIRFVKGEGVKMRSRGRIKGTKDARPKRAASKRKGKRKSDSMAKAARKLTINKIKRKPAKKRSAKSKRKPAKRRSKARARKA